MRCKYDALESAQCPVKVVTDVAGCKHTGFFATKLPFQ